MINPENMVIQARTGQLLRSRFGFRVFTGFPRLGLGSRHGFLGILLRFRALPGCSVSIQFII